jgi:hypothetical protein
LSVEGVKPRKASAVAQKLWRTGRHARPRDKPDVPVPLRFNAGHRADGLFKRMHLSGHIWFPTLVSDTGQDPTRRSTSVVAVQARDGFSLVWSNILEMSQNEVRSS